MTKKLNTNLIKIVNILSDGQYHDGDTIGQKLEMTRSAVWKAIKKLEHYAIQIDSVKGKGYALLQPLTLLELSKIKKKLLNKKIDLTIFESIPSTNDYFKSLKNTKTGTIKICLAEEQTQGKGRLSRDWYSPFGQNIYLSCLYPFQKDISELAGLSLVISLSMLKALKRDEVKKKLSVKWPNDIVCENKKLAGSLIEIQAETHGMSHAIIGIGINVNMVNDTDHITQAWTSMRMILGQAIDRNDLCADLINHLLQDLQQFNAHGFQSFSKEWMSADCLMNKTIALNNMNEKIKGKVMGIDEQGRLLLRLNDGAIRAFSSGDTSIVKPP